MLPRIIYKCDTTAHLLERRQSINRVTVDFRSKSDSTSCDFSFSLDNLYNAINYIIFSPANQYEKSLLSIFGSRMFRYLKSRRILGRNVNRWYPDRSLWTVCMTRAIAAHFFHGVGCIRKQSYHPLFDASCHRYERRLVQVRVQQRGHHIRWCASRRRCILRCKERRDSSACSLDKILQNALQRSVSGCLFSEKIWKIWNF